MENFIFIHLFGFHLQIFFSEIKLFVCFFALYGLQIKSSQFEYTLKVYMQHHGNNNEIKLNSEKNYNYKFLIILFLIILKLIGLKKGKKKAM